MRKVRTDGSNRTRTEQCRRHRRLLHDSRAAGRAFRRGIAVKAGITVRMTQSRPAFERLMRLMVATVPANRNATLGLHRTWTVATGSAPRRGLAAWSPLPVCPWLPAGGRRHAARHGKVRPASNGRSFEHDAPLTRAGLCPAGNLREVAEASQAVHAGWVQGAQADARRDRNFRHAMRLPRERPARPGAGAGTGGPVSRRPRSGCRSAKAGVPCQPNAAVNCGKASNRSARRP